MSQLGAGFGSEYPNAIDTRQVYRNGTVVLPDSDTRIDSEYLNDTLTAIVQMQTALGAGIQGAFSSLAARLAALESGGSPLTNVVAFTNQAFVNVPGAAHQQGQQALLFAVYDDSTPRQALGPETLSVYPGTYNVELTFELPQSGVVMVAALTPQYIVPFTTPATPPYTVTIPGSAHALAQTYLFFQAYDNAVPAQAIDIGSLQVNATTKDVVVSFPVAQSGTLVLAVGSPRYVQAFTTTGSPPSVTILGSAHGLASADLLYQLYDASPDPAAMPPGSLTVHPTTFDVALTFAVPQSGTVVLAPVPSVAPPLLLAVLPHARTVQAPLIATRTVVDDRLTAHLQEDVETLTARLTTLETAYQALLTQHHGPAAEESAS